MSTKNLYPIRYVSRQTGLTPHAIRAWEKRYGAVTPQRTGTNRRLYSDKDIERLNLLNRAVRAGNAIGQIASLSRKELQSLASQSNTALPPPEKHTPPVANSQSSFNHYDACVTAITNFDTEALENALNQAAIELNRINLLEVVVNPLIQKIGELWSDGSLKIYHEHMASSVLRTFLGDILRFSDVQPSAPDIVVATPAGQHHELGALIVAVATASEGWRVTYLGVNLPSEEIAGAAESAQSKVVCLSLVFPTDDPKLIFEIKRLRRYLPKETMLVIGGQAADAYGKHLEPSDAMIIQTVSHLLNELRSLR
jgi:DNA-binding transcriptional MerR regulator/methylmalonyl-CoA mutase cobalamin-binding subunit